MYEVQSKNTGHYWVIMPLIDHQFKYVRLMYKYKKEHEYHEQTTMASVLDAVLKIMFLSNCKSSSVSSVYSKIDIGLMRKVG